MQPPLAFLVDDDDDFRSVFGEVLREEGYHVVEASNGAEAMAMLDCVQPDLMLIDLLMPVMNGWALFDSIERRPELSHMPVVFLSAVPEMAPTGGSLVVAKPFSLESLRSLLDALRPAPSSGGIDLKAARRTRSRQWKH